MFNQGGLWIGAFLRRAIGMDEQPRPRPVQPYYTGGPATVTGAGTSQASATLPAYQTQPSGVPQQQDDPLARFERLARLMDIGERVGSAFDKGPMQTISSGGGVAHPLLPNPQNYGLGSLRR